MTGVVSETLLAQLNDRIAGQMGLHFPVQRLPDLRKGIQAASVELGFNDPESCIRSLVASPLSRQQIDVLAAHLTIGETYFFRDRPTFDVLRDSILPELFRSRQGSDRRLKIWCAGCATGEEAYSLAIVCSAVMPELFRENAGILATDINPHFLQKAVAGRYREWSFRGVAKEIKETCFQKTADGFFEILPRIRSMVRFMYLNLAEDVYPSLTTGAHAMDIIFCRNVIMYFNSEHQRKVIQNLYRCLMPGGYLITSPSEAPHLPASLFHAVNFPKAVFYRKDETGAVPKPMGPVKHPIPGKAQPAARLLPEYSRKVRRAAPVAKPLEITPPSPDSGSAEPLPKPLTPYDKAAAAYRQGLYAEAAAILQGTAAENPEHYSLLVRALANQGRLVEALRWCEKAVAADKFNPAFYYLRATLLQERDRIDEAVRSLRQALYIDPDFALAHFALGSIAWKQRKFKESIKHFFNARSILKHCPKDDMPPGSDGMTAGRLKEIVEAMLASEL